MNGRIVWETVGSVVLKGNPLGDPRLRELPVYLPPSYKNEPERRYPVIYFLTGFTGTARGLIETHPWKESVAERLDRLIAARKMPECLLVAPDCFTRYGGSQYLNSAGTGAYADHIVSELVPYMDARYRTKADAEARAVMGKSSGGYGALMFGLRYPEVFRHAVSHSGDLFFEICYGRDFPKCVNALAAYNGGFQRFVKEFSLAREKSGFPQELVNLAGMGSCYSPNRRSPIGFDIPFDERTGELIPAVWKRWQACDPVRLAARCVRALNKLTTLYFDCGVKDEFFLHLGARKFSQVLKKLGVRHVYEEHARGHFDMNERYDRSLVRLGRELRKTG
ncbi:MAG: alpha/beta hydrolase-fold protein [Elusimicrobiota bacterium]